MIKLINNHQERYSAKRQTHHCQCMEKMVSACSFKNLSQLYALFLRILFCKIQKRQSLNQRLVYDNLSWN